MINIGYQILQVKTSKYLSVFPTLPIQYVDPMLYRNAVQGVSGWYKFAAYHVRCPWFGVWMRRSLCFPSGPVFWDLVSGSNQTQMVCGPNSLDVTLLCRQKWVSKGLREPTILVSPTYSQHPTLHIEPIILCK